MPAASLRAGWRVRMTCGRLSRALSARGASAWHLTARYCVAIDPNRTFKPINIALLTVSDTRGPEDDTSGDILAQRIRDAGHKLVARAIEKDDAQRIASRFNNWRSEVHTTELQSLMRIL